jgi:hypothetical protein
MSTFYSFQSKGENIVANLSLYNPITATSSIPAVIDIPLEKPILSRASDYKMTIIRFNAPLDSIQSNYDMTGKIFTIRFKTSNNTFTRKISGDNIIGFSVLSFLNAIIQILANLTMDIGQPANRAPYFIWDENTGKFFLIICYIVFAALTGIDISKALQFFMGGLPVVNFLMGSIVYF